MFSEKQLKSFEKSFADHAARRLGVVVPQAHLAVSKLKSIFQDYGIKASETKLEDGVLHFDVPQGDGLRLDFAIATYQSEKRGLQGSTGLVVKMQMTLKGKDKALALPHVTLTDIPDESHGANAILQGRADNAALVACKLAPIILKQSV